MLTQEFRPRTFKEVKGQPTAVKLLRAIIKDPESSPKVLILHGGFGCGKSSIARVFARALACENPTPNGDCCGKCDSCLLPTEDIPSCYEFDSSYVGNVDGIENVKTVMYRNHSCYKVIILDESHLINRSAGSALLKILEEIPPKTFVVFATTDIEKMLPTIRSRSLEIEIHTIAENVVADHLRSIATTRHKELSDDIILYITHKAQGHMRNAVMELDRFFLVGDDLLSLNKSTIPDWCSWLGAVLSRNTTYVNQYISNLLNSSLSLLRSDYELFVLELMQSFSGIDSKYPIVNQITKQLGIKTLTIVKLLLSDQMLNAFSSDSILKCTLLWFYGSLGGN